MRALQGPRLFFSFFPFIPHTLSVPLPTPLRQARHVGCVHARSLPAPPPSPTLSGAPGVPPCQAPLAEAPPPLASTPARQPHGGAGSSPSRLARQLRPPRHPPSFPEGGIRRRQRPAAPPLLTRSRTVAPPAQGQSPPCAPRHLAHTLRSRRPSRRCPGGAAGQEAGTRRKGRTPPGAPPTVAPRSGALP